MQNHEVFKQENIYGIQQLATTLLIGNFAKLKAIFGGDQLD